MDLVTDRVIEVSITNNGSLPQAGGPSDQTSRALGELIGLLDEVAELLRQSLQRRREAIYLIDDLLAEP